MKSILSCVALVACGGSGGGPAAPAPSVSTVTPGSGNWATQITIDGQNFGDVQGTGTVAFGGSVGANGFVVDTWSDGEITGRVAFPAAGAFTVNTAGGAADATFATTEPWVPSSPFDVTELAEEVVLSTGDVAAIYQEFELTAEPTLAVFSGSAAGTYPMADLLDTTDPGAPLFAKLVEADDQTPEVIATKPDGFVAAFALQSGSLMETPTGIDGNVIAAGRDATGAYAWIEIETGIERARPGSPWTVDRGPFATTYPPLDGAIGSDGTLWLAVDEPVGSDSANVELETLGSAGSAFGALEEAYATSVAGDIATASIAVGPDGTQALVTATATTGGAPTSLTPRLRVTAGSWSDAPSVTGLVQYGFIGSALGAIVDDAQSKTTSLVPDVTMPSAATVIPVWPTQSVGFAVDGSGTVRPLVANGDAAYALAPGP